MWCVAVTGKATWNGLLINNVFINNAKFKLVKKTKTDIVNLDF